MGTLAYRAIGAALLDHSTYEGIEADRTATRQALVVVIASSLIVVITLVALATWIAWAVLILEVGGRHLRRPETRVDLGELIRTVGFAASPGLFQIFALIPEVAAPVFLLSWVWMWAAMVVAVRHALDLSGYGRAIVVCGVALAISLGTALVVGIALQRVVV
jgi:hypothetical protein